MAIDKLDLLEQVGDTWVTTNTIAKRVRTNWHIIFGLLCILYKDDYLELQEVRMTGTRKTFLWRKKNE